VAENAAVGLVGGFHILAPPNLGVAPTPGFPKQPSLDALAAHRRVEWMS